MSHIHWTNVLDKDPAFAEYLNAVEDTIAKRLRVIENINTERTLHEIHGLLGEVRGMRYALCLLERSKPKPQPGSVTSE